MVHRMDPVYSLNKLAAILHRPRWSLEQIASEAEDMYRPFWLERPGKKRRRIDNPIEPLKSVQKRIHRCLLRDVGFPAFMQGAVKGGSAARNAEIHVGKRCVVTIDIADCFPSITNRMVFKVWRRGLGHSPTVARLLTRLTTAWGHLPQGAPTSPALANLALLPAVSEICELASARGLHLGQFLDDSGISGGGLPTDMVTQICKVFSRKGLRIRRGKIRVMRSGARQIVTGHTVNTKVGIPRDERSRIRAAVYELEREGIDSPEGGTKLLSVRGRVARLMRFHPSVGTALNERLERLGGPVRARAGASRGPTFVSEASRMSERA